MEKDLVAGKLGTIGAYDLKLDGGKLIASCDAQVGPAVLKVSLELDAAEVAKLLLTKIEDAVPGELDNVVIDAVKAEIDTLVGDAVAEASPEAK